MKKIIAAAVAAAIIAPASVMAAGPTLYGKIQMAVEYQDNNGSNIQRPASEAGTYTDDSEYKEWNLSSRNSRIGVKGSEDLGNGMKVGYLIEWDVSMDGDSSLGTRNRAVTLSGDWGTVLAGKWDTPFKTLGRKFDMFGDRIGDLRNLNTGAVIDQRADNVFAYVTPNMNGFSATVAYSFDALATGLDNNGNSLGGDNSDSEAWTFNALYNNGPILLGLGYVNYSEGSFSDSDTSSCFVNSAVNNCESESAIRAGGSYTFGDFKVAATYTDISDASGVDGADTSIWSLGGSYTMGNNTIKVQYANRDEYDDWNDATNTRVVNSGNDTGADMWAIGLDHAMSKRTTVYAAYATTSNDDNSDSTSWSEGNSSNMGFAGVNRAGNYQDADSFAVGIIHKF